MTSPAAPDPRPPGELFDRLPIGAYRSTLDGRQLRANAALVRMNGYASEAELLAAVQDIGAEWYVDPQRREAFKACMARDGQVTDFVSEVHRHRTRERIWVRETAHLVRDDQGQPLFYEGTVEDITAALAAQHALARSEQRFQRAFVASPDALAISRVADGTLLEVNPTYLALSGYTLEELVGRHTLDLGLWARPADRQAFIACLQRDGRVRDFVAAYQGKPGFEGVVSISAELIEVDGEACVLGIARDVTQALADRQALERLNAELEARVAERTAQLEATLAEARRMNRELQTFAYSVSHDLKAPLRALDGYSLLLAQHADGLDDEARGHLQRIREAARQMARLTDDLLAYARLEHEALSPQPLAIARLVPQVLAQHAADLERLGVQPELALPELTVRADPAALVMALRNLVDNALKFGSRQPGPLRLAIGAEQQPQALVLWVRDNGPGFDMKYHDRIFQIFQRLHRAEEVAGTGVGLAMVAKAMARMGGRTWAESAPGQGATFYLALPQTGPGAPPPG